jgi:hypothetical protein
MDLVRRLVELGAVCRQQPSRIKTLTTMMYNVDFYVTRVKAAV